MNSRVTLRHIAQQANVHFSTVSLALRNDPQIPKATRERIQAIAKEMGYRPDAMLSALSDYRWSKTPPQHQGTLAWINNHFDKDYLNSIELYRSYYEGALARSDELGYKLEEFWLRQPGMTIPRFHSILKARNIEGILLPPQPRGTHELNLQWQDVSAVAFGESLELPRLDAIHPNLYRGVHTIMKELRACGYKRIGFMMDTGMDRRCEDCYMAAYWIDHWRIPPAQRVKPLLFSKGLTEDVFRKWFLAEKPDAITPGWDGDVIAWLERLGKKVPDDVGMAYHTVSPKGDLGGLTWDAHKMGATAVEFLLMLLSRQTPGIPKSPQRFAMEGTWYPGKTVRSIKP